MIITSVSLPGDVGKAWQRNKASIMRYAIRCLRIALRERGVRRGCSRLYNRSHLRSVRVTTRFSDAEYDSLHLAAATMRVSVSLIIFKCILIWQKRQHQNLKLRLISNYELNLTLCGRNGIVVSENLLFWPKFWPRILRDKHGNYKISC